MNKENVKASEEKENHECSINVDINGFSLLLSAHSNPPKAEDLFHAMFFEEELKKAPTHYRQQRWNKRRIQKRWNWKRGREREIYEKRAEYLKNKWIEMKKDYKSNNNTFLSNEFLEKNKNLKINFTETNDKSGTNSPLQSEREKIALAAEDSLREITIQSHNKQTKIEGKRKHIRRREKLIERIANGEHFESFVDHQKLHNTNTNDNLLFRGVNQNSNYKKSKPKKSKKKIKSMKLADFVQATNSKQFTNHKKNNCNNTENNAAHGNSNNNVSFADIQAEQTKNFQALIRKKRDEIHSLAMLQNNDYSSKLFPQKNNTNTKKTAENTTENACFCINPVLNDSMNIFNYDYMIYRSKTISEIYFGNSVFPCIPICIEPSNTLLIEAMFIERLLLPHSSLSKLSGLFELKKRLKKQFQNKTIEILPIFERAYIHKQCQQLLLIQFQDNINVTHNLSENDSEIACALSLYQSWNNKNNNSKNQLRIEFVEPWFSKSYFLQHSHLWSDIALNSMITIYDNNSNYIKNINKNARHCRCSFKRIAYFPPFNPKPHSPSHNQYLHSINCIPNCCCCTFYNQNDSNNKSYPNHIIQNGDIVMWHGRKCITHSKVNDSNQYYRIQIDQFIGTYIVALSSLQIVNKYRNINTNQIIKVNSVNDLNTVFDSQKHIWDDLSFVLYIKQFWNISN